MNEKMTPYLENKIREEQKKIINCIGLECYFKLAYEFGGGTIYIAKPDVIAKGERNECILRDFRNGLTINQLKTKYRLSDVWIRKIVDGTI